MVSPFRATDVIPEPAAKPTASTSESESALAGRRPLARIEPMVSELTRLPPPYTPGHKVPVSGIYGRTDGGPEIVALRGRRFPPGPAGVGYFLTAKPRTFTPLAREEATA